MIATEPDRSLTEGFSQVGGSGKPRYGQLAICYDTDREAARKLWRWDLSSVALPSPSLTLPVVWPAFSALSSALIVLSPYLSVAVRAAEG
jgi:hypothetical protein